MGARRKTDLGSLRRQALSSSLFRPTTLRKAVERLGFVQADPIRSPARAQDLILRQRVKEYRAGELERRYPSLSLEEDFLYAYGFMPRSTWQLLHPRAEARLNAIERQVLEIVAAHKRIHPRELEAYLGNKREVNAWGGYSKATTRALQTLHYRGLLRIAGRENGIRLYEATAAVTDTMPREERLRRLVLLIANILAPLPAGSLRATLRHLAQAAPHLEGRQSAVSRLIDSGDLETAVVDEVQYVWPAGPTPRKQPDDRVRFLAPFDPLVWDRRRFEHFWGWAYRFEAYTPPAKRKLGYYAMPLLWQEHVIGWVNILQRKKELAIEYGWEKEKPDSAVFRQQCETEFERLRHFLRGDDTPPVESS